mgnify:CR=1 FL=1
MRKPRPTICMKVDLYELGRSRTTQDVGVAVLERLRGLDEVAYLRFASVYRAFTELEDFESEIALLRAEREFNPGISSDSTTQ